MKLTMNQFEVLVAIEREKRKISQRELSNITKLSLGTINNTITELIKNNYPFGGL